MRFVHTPNAICATTETGRVSGAILKRPPEWANALWDRLAPQVCELLSAQPRGVTCADLIAQGYLKPLPPKGQLPTPHTHIELNKAEKSSGVTRVQWAERLIHQLPADHDGRNSWLLNYGSKPVADFTPAQPADRVLEDWISYGLAVYHASVKKDELIESLHGRLAETQRAVGEAQTGLRQVDLGEQHLRSLLSAKPECAAVHDPKANVLVRRV